MQLYWLTHTAFKSLKTNKKRSFLTILGMVIGVMAIVVVMAAGKGAEKLILDQIEGFGAELISVEPGREPSSPADFIELLTDSLKARELAALKNPSYVQGVEEVTPLVASVANVSYENEIKRAQLRGSSDLVLSILNLSLAEGTFFADDDVGLYSSVAVLGAEVKEELFGQRSPLGEKVKIKNRAYRVIGTLKAKGPGIIPVDEMVFIPYTTAQKYVIGIDYYHTIMVRAASKDVVDRVKQDIILTLRELHDITDPDKDDFHVHTQQDAVERVGVIATVLTVLLTSIAAISLLVGGVGIMNIMLVSVTERTREIGLRKAIGATRRDILSQFLFEAILLTGIGGLIGILLGVGIAFVAALILNRIVPGWSFIFPWQAALLGLFVSTLIGLIFGIYPARQAAQKSPIEALRYE